MARRCKAMPRIVRSVGSIRSCRCRRSPPRPSASFTSGAAHGFNVMPAVLPSGLELFVDEVVPLLRKRGLFRSEYTGTTLRDHYGLTRPENQYASVAAE
jgi:hypothetical protein